MYRYRVVVRLKTGLRVLDEMDSDFKVKRQEINVTGAEQWLYGKLKTRVIPVSFFNRMIEKV